MEAKLTHVSFKGLKTINKNLFRLGKANESVRQHRKLVGWSPCFRDARERPPRGSGRGGRCWGLCSLLAVVSFL